MYYTKCIIPKYLNLSSYSEKNSATKTIRLKRVIGILVNWHISTGILTRIASYPRQNTLLKCVNSLGYQWLAQKCRLCCRISVNVIRRAYALDITRSQCIIGPSKMYRKSREEMLYKRTLIWHKYVLIEFDSIKGNI